MDDYNYNYDYNKRTTKKTRLSSLNLVFKVRIFCMLSSKYADLEDKIKTRGRLRTRIREVHRHYSTLAKLLQVSQSCKSL